MKSGPLLQVSVTTSREAEEATAALLERLFGQPASIYAPEASLRGTSTVYSSLSRDEVLAKRDALDAGLQFLSACELALGRVKIVIRKVPPEDWAESWKRHFPPIEIGSALLIKPSWSQRPVRKGQAVVTLDPGLSFGTGQHPTTRFCLEQLLEARKIGHARSCLDIGTGSGILAIAAAKLGYKRVRALDNDAVAVRVARVNARNNRVSEKLVLVREDLTAWPLSSRVRYDVVCANLIFDLLVEQGLRILNRLQPGGRLILAGLLAGQFGEARKVYERAGLRLITSRKEGEWRSGAFQSAMEAVV